MTNFNINLSTYMKYMLQSSVCPICHRNSNCEKEVDGICMPNLFVLEVFFLFAFLKTKTDMRLLLDCCFK